MLDANYQTHFKVLGKLAKLYDDAAADEAAQLTLASTTYDQVATGASASWDTVLLFSGYASQWSSCISAGAAALQAMALQIAAAYLKTSVFLDTFVVATPTNTSSANSILTALALEMASGGGGDNKTLGTKTTSGLVNFFDAVAEEALTWNTESDSTADYRDAIYVVSTVV